jgi:hypothetical protein
LCISKVTIGFIPTLAASRISVWYSTAVAAAAAAMLAAAALA